MEFSDFNYSDDDLDAVLDYELVDKKLKTQERNEREINRFIAQLEAWSGNKVTEAGLKEAIELCNEYRQALRAFTELRKKDNCRVNGSEALTVIGGSMFMDRKAAVEAVKAVTEEAAAWPVVEGTRVYYAGSPQETTEVYEIAEASGCCIVGEDHDMGDRMFDTDVRTDIAPVSALAERLITRMPSSEKGSIKERVKFVGEKLNETQAELFLTYMNKNDEAYVWDLPSIKRNVLEPNGIASYTIEGQTWPLTDPEGLKAKFAEMAKLGKEAK
jgi:benzoyl-CoA reductase/2-hydroxyglutaryl-CoA dehydratase subunit BcrC/BadD/HgdB